MSGLKFEFTKTGTYIRNGVIGSLLAAGAIDTLEDKGSVGELTREVISIPCDAVDGLPVLGLRKWVDAIPDDATIFNEESCENTAARIDDGWDTFKRSTHLDSLINPSAG
jgi:hypothetical protein